MRYLNFFINSLNSQFSLILIAYLNFADLDCGLIFNSSKLAVIGFLCFKLKHFIPDTLFGRYLEEFLISE